MARRDHGLWSGIGTAMGVDTFAVYNPNTSAWLFSNNPNNAAPSTVASITFGQSGDIPLSGDWDGDGLDNIGVFRPSTGEWRLYTPRITQVNQPVPTPIQQVIIVYGQAGETGNTLNGAWVPGLRSGLGLYRGPEFSLERPSGSGGSAPIEPNAVEGADYAFTFGSYGDKPVAGRWQGQLPPNQTPSVTPTYNPSATIVPITPAPATQKILMLLCKGAWFTQEWGCKAAGTIAYHKYLLGWLPADHITIVLPDSQPQVINLQPVALPRPSTAPTNRLVAFIPIPGTQEFYSVEVRARTYIPETLTYDDGLRDILSSLPAVVVVHRIDPSRGSDAQVVDVDALENGIKYWCQNGNGNGNPNDIGARMQTGETFYDHVSGISIQVLLYNQATSVSPGTYKVIIENTLINRVFPLPTLTTCH